MSNLLPVHFNLCYRAIPKANKHKVGRRGFGKNAKCTVLNDLTGVLKKSEHSFCTQALSYVGCHEGIPFTCPVEAEVEFVFGVTAGWPQWKKDAALRGEFLCEKTPDLENVAKFVFDALEGSFYDDDKRIFKQTLLKRYGVEDRVIVTLTPFAQATAPAGATKRRKK